MRRLTLLIASALFLMGAGDGPQAKQWTVKIWETRLVGQGNLGWTWTFEPSNRSLVYITPNMESEDQRKRVIVHEMFHAVGLKGHPWEDTACYCYKDGLNKLPEHLCPQEKKWLQDSNVKATISVGSPILRSRVRWAVDYINAEIGRTVYTIVE